MTSDASQFPTDRLTRAAQYVRMSTDHQQYSTDNQKDAIAKYAAELGYEIVTTYEDFGRSGLNIEGRAGLQRLLSDIESGTADFDVVVVYDVSRWGRFQNIDESAFYEFRCYVAGVRIEYCAEQFPNDGSTISSIMKTLVRVGAADHSRVLSVKVHAGQSRLITLGFRQGGPAGYGLRRLLIDVDGEPKTLLARGERKSLQTDRVILVPGPDEEIEIVRLIYRAFVSDGRSETEIALELNRRGVLTDWDHPWSRGTIHQILINEKYIGNNVWNRQSIKLTRHRVNNAPEEWVRAVGVFEAIVDHGLFERAQAIIQARSVRLSDEDLLDILRKLLDRTGSLSGLIIDEAPGCPSSSAYQSRFGSLSNAYQLVGYEPDRDCRYIEINRRLRAMHPGIVEQTVSEITALGAGAIVDAEHGLIDINGEFSVSLVIVRCKPTPAGTLRWHVRLDRGHDPDITVAVRMEPDGQLIHDYLIIPTADVSGEALRTFEFNDISLSSFLFPSLEPLFDLSRRFRINEVL